MVRHQFVHFGAEVFVEVFDVLRQASVFQASVFLPLLLLFGFALAQVALFFGRGTPGLGQQQVAVGVVKHEDLAFAAAGQYRYQLKIMFVQFEYGAVFQLFANLGFYIGTSRFRRFSGGF